MNTKGSEEHYLLVIRTMQFMNIWTVYTDFISGRYRPGVGANFAESQDGLGYLARMSTTLMFLLYAFFYSLVEDSSDGLDSFRVWLVRHPEEETAVLALKSLVTPILPELRFFRNKLGFHGSRSHAAQEKGFLLFEKVTGDTMLEIIRQFRMLNAALVAKENALGKHSDEELKEARVKIDEVTATCQKIKRNERPESFDRE